MRQPPARRSRSSACARRGSGRRARRSSAAATCGRGPGTSCLLQRAGPGTARSSSDGAQVDLRHLRRFAYRCSLPGLAGFTRSQCTGLGPRKMRSVRRGGESGIRTHGTVSRTHAFQACTFSHSVISPRRNARAGHEAPGRWRRGWDSNPRASSRRQSAFEAPPLRPLRYLSGSLDARRPDAGVRRVARGRTRSSSSRATRRASTPPCTVSNRWLKSAPTRPQRLERAQSPRPSDPRAPIHEAVDPRVERRAEAHQARLDRAVQRRARRDGSCPMRRRGLAHREHLGVRRRVGPSESDAL